MRGTLIVALSVLALTAPPLIAKQPADLLIRHATVIDVEQARTIPGQAIATRGGRIAAVGGDAQIAAHWHARTTIDARGRYLIPGLWDMHVHFGGGPDLIEENQALLPLYIAHGITTYPRLLR